MLRSLGFLVTLMALSCLHYPVQPCTVQSDRETPLHLEKTEPMTEWEYEMIMWWNPFLSDNTLWLVYQELTFDNVKILKYRTFNGEWSSPQILSDTGNFVAAVGNLETLTFFWNTAVKGESEMIKSICFRTLAQEWSSPSCTEAEPYIGDQFVVRAPDGNIWLLWSRRGFWEYQVFEKDHWGEKQQLATTEEYDKILRAFSREDEVWLFYETGASDIYYRVLDQTGLSEPYPLVTEGFPYIHDIVQYGATVMVFLEVQEADTDQKALVYTVYDGEWSSLQAVASPQDGFLSGGSAVRMPDGRIFVFWNGTDAIDVQPWEVDIFYRVYDGGWSGIYRLTDTPDAWETSVTGVEYNGSLILIWREKESLIVYASYVGAGEGESAEPAELEKVTPKTEPEKPERHSKIWNVVEKYLPLLLVGAALAAFSAVFFLKRRISSQKEKKIREIKVGERRKKKKAKKKKK